MINFGLHAGMLFKTKRWLGKGNILINDSSGQKPLIFRTEMAFLFTRSKKFFTRPDAPGANHP
jgi:hypothetical protein